VVVSAAQDTCRSVDVIIATDELIGLTKVTRAPSCLITLYVEVFDVGWYVVSTVYALDHDVLQQTNKMYVATLSRVSVNDSDETEYDYKLQRLRSLV